MKQDRKEKGNVPNLRFPEFEGEWEWYKLGDIAEIIGGGTPSTNIEEFWNGEIQWFTPSEIKSNYISKSERTITKLGLSKSSAKLLPAGTILLTTRATIGEVAIATEECTTNQGFQSLIVNNNINNVFIANWIKKNKDEFIKRAKGSTFAEISKIDINEMPIISPAIIEQNKIASFLSLLEERIETQSQIIEKYESLIKGIYTYLLRESNKYRKLGEFCQIKKGEQINRTELLEIGKYYVMNGGVTPSGFYHSFNTKRNTISVSEGGNSCGYVQYNDVPFWSGGHCYTLENIDKNVNDRYLFHYLKANELQIMALRIGSGLPNIQKKDLSLFCVPVPSLLNQKEIANALDKIIAKIELEKFGMAAYQKQKRYLLQSLFI
ncbi:MAG: restriction endonuclease subunit S [Mediterranea sp.]|jgi:type I restriction enzyme S subunit|nr:restriction endonuclease subunit S [Mediterranea sp.]